MRLPVIFLLVMSCGYSQLGAAQPTAMNSTPVWNFLCERYAFGGVLDVQVSKTNKGGQLRLAVESATLATSKIAGTTYLFLKNNSSITCTDKNKHSVEGTKIISYYDLTATEMYQLQQSNIDYIHFNIKGKSTSFSSQMGNFTAINKRSYFGKDTPEKPNYFATALACKALN